MKKYSNFIARRYKIILVSWIILALILSPLAPKLNEKIVYSVEITLPNSEFQISVEKLQKEFANRSYDEAFLNVLASYNYYLLIKTDKPFSEEVKNADTFIRDNLNLDNKTPISYYGLIEILLRRLGENTTRYANELYEQTFILFNHTSSIKKQLKNLMDTYQFVLTSINNSLYFTYAPPYVFLKCFEALKIEDFYQRSERARLCAIAKANLQGLSLDYFNKFYSRWLSGISDDPYNAADKIIKEIAPSYLSDHFKIDNNTIKTIFSFVNIFNWREENVVRQISLQIIINRLNEKENNKYVINEIIKLLKNETNLEEVTYKIIKSSNFNLTNRIGENLIDEFIKNVINKDTMDDDIARDIVSKIITDYTLKTNNNNPYFVINEKNYKEFVKTLIKNDSKKVTRDIILNKDVAYYPIDLRNDLKSAFIDQKNNIFLIVIYSNHYPNEDEVKSDLQKFEDIKLKLNNLQVYITGIPLLSYELRNAAEYAMFLIIPLGIALVFFLTSLYFRSIITGFLILLLFGISITTTLGLAYIILDIILNREISFITPAIVVVLVLGLCSDYAVYLLRRYKIEREEGKTKEEALFLMTFWSARGVFTSALAVFFAYLVLSFMNIALFGDAAMINVIGIGFTMITNLLFLPSLLYVLGDRAVKLSMVKIKNSRINLIRIASFNEKRKKELTLILIITTLISLIFVSKIETVLDIPPLMPPSDVQKGALLLSSTIGSSMSPIYLYVEGKDDVVVKDKINHSYLNYVENITKNIEKIKDIKYIYTINRPFGERINLNEIYLNDTLKKIYKGSIERFIGKSNKGVLILITIDKQPFSLEAIEVLKEIRNSIPKNEDFKLYFSGVTQLSYDSKTVTDSVTPTILVSLITIIIILLFLQFISVLIPFRLVSTILASIAWSLALLYIVYVLIFDLPLINAVPLFLLVTMLGVGVDYDIFLLTRVREEIVKGKNDEEAIRIALDKTGKTIMFLGLLLGGTFFLLLIPNFPLLNEIGFAIGLGVLFDAFLIIPFFVPSIMLLAKKWNWWPSKLNRR